MRNPPDFVIYVENSTPRKFSSKNDPLQNKYMPYVSRDGTYAAFSTYGDAADFARELRMMKPGSRAHAKMYGPYR